MRKTALWAVLVTIGIVSLVTGGIVVNHVVTTSRTPRSCSTRYVAPGFSHTASLARRVTLKIKKGLAAPALSVAIARDGKLLWSESYGMADVQHRLPLCRTSLIDVGSVAKVFTGAAVGQLWQQGKLDLDVPIQRYVPTFPRKAWPITSRELAEHTSGIRHYQGDEFANTHHYRTLRAGLAIFEHDPLLFRPGTRFHYSSYGYNLLGVAIEGASRQSYLAYMAQHIFRPLGMIHTVPDTSPNVSGRARSYEFMGMGLVTPAPYTDVSYKWPSGGYLSTPDDLVRFGSALMGSHFLQSGTRRLLFTPGRTTSGKSTGYAFGWQLGKDSQGHPGLRALGSALGSIGMLSLLPRQHLALALTMNVNVAAGVEPGPTPDPLQIAQIFLSRYSKNY